MVSCQVPWPDSGVPAWPHPSCRFSKCFPGSATARAPHTSPLQLCRLPARGLSPMKGDVVYSVVYVWQPRSKWTLHPCFPGSFPPFPPWPAHSGSPASEAEALGWAQECGYQEERVAQARRTACAQGLARCWHSALGLSGAAALPAGPAFSVPGLPGEHAGSREAAPPKKAQSWL